MDCFNADDMVSCCPKRTGLDIRVDHQFWIHLPHLQRLMKLLLEGVYFVIVQQAQFVVIVKVVQPVVASVLAGSKTHAQPGNHWSTMQEWL
jgi:hypothetical protein